MTVKLIKFETPEALFSYAAKDFLHRAQETLAHKEFFDVALAGGTTAQGFFNVLAREACKISYLNKIRFFFSDERAVALSSPESNAGNAWAKLLLPLGVSANNFFPMFDNSCSVVEAAHNYEQMLKSLNIYNFDIIYLGLGLDGHTASLFPQSDLVMQRDYQAGLVAATAENFAGFRRITFMPALINAAKNICVMSTGVNKIPVIERILFGPLVPQELPAQLVLRAQGQNYRELLQSN
jgi:6-phosphogluconolactonase